MGNCVLHRVVHCLKAFCASILSVFIISRYYVFGRTPWILVVSNIGSDIAACTLMRI
jgi:hypothetical protein